jgi:hypothetical protein
MQVSLNILGSMLIDVAGNQLDASFLGVSGNVLDHFRIVKDPSLPDQDQDGVPDALDDCLVEANPGQLDTDQDGYGNLCDSDYDGDGVVSGLDFSVLRSAYQSQAGGPNWDADVDANGDGAVAAFDFTRFRAAFSSSPGPSGLSCAGTPPCPAP